jgi:hypothetical protein
LEVLLCYRGRVSYEVGLLIADIVERYGGYQSELWEVLGEVFEDYSYVMKAMAFEEKLKVKILKGSWLWRL